MNTNKITLTGKINNVGNAFLAKNGTVCTRCVMEVERLSTTVDTIQLLIPDTVAKHDYLVTVANNESNCVTIQGSLRSANKVENNKRKLVLYVHVDTISEEEPDEFNFNSIEMTGTIVRKPMYRHTPLGRIVADVFIAHNPDDKKTSYYFPCVAWGAAGVNISNLNVGDKIKIDGRFQSRKYNKIVDDKVEERTAYEISINNFVVEE